jgi:hypothetical protein
MSKLGFLCIIFVMLFVSSCVSESDATVTTSLKETVPITELIKQSDELYRQREDLNKLRESLKLLKRARTAEPENFEVNWKIAQADYFLGKNSPDDKESAKAFKEGIEAAKAASRLAPDKPDGYFWTGANLGGQAQKDAISGITSLGEIREAMNKVIEIQPDYQAASAYDALAQIELHTRLTGGSAEKALEYLEKAQALGKENSYINLHLAEAYLALDRDADARKQIDIILKTKPNPDFLPEYKDAERQARKLLETKF